MSLINSSYMVGEFKVGNLDANHPAGVINTAELNRFIAKYEPQYLKKIMGGTMYDEFIAGLAAGSPEAKWTELRDQLIDSTNKLSPIAAYVWYYHSLDKITSTGSFGETGAKAENSTPESPRPKMAKAWDTAMNGAYDVASWINERLDTYTTAVIDLDQFGIDNTFGI